MTLPLLKAGIFPTSLFISWTILTIIITTLLIKRHGFQERLGRSLVLYLGASFLLELVKFFIRQGWLEFVNPSIFVWLLLCGEYVLSVLFLILSIEFLNIKINTHRWQVIGISWFLILIVFISISSVLPENTTVVNRIVLHRENIIILILSMVITGWVLFLGRTGLLTINAYRQAKQPLHKNRVIYWGIAVGFLLIGGVYLFEGFDSGGSLLRLVGAVLTVYAVLTHDLMDLSQAGLKSLNYLIYASVALIIYTASYAFIQSAFQSLPTWSPLRVGVILAIFLVFIVNPVLNLVGKWINHLIFGFRYDTSATVQEYSTSISNIVNLENLVKVSLDLIDKTFEVKRSLLFVVDKEEKEEKSFFRLQGIQTTEEGDHCSSMLAADGLLANYFCTTHRPLTQYDIDFLPQFREIPVEEHNWLTGLEVDVYVPIHSKAGWIGLFALGPKTSGRRFFDVDLSLLSILADQSAVALENARLFTDLTKLNTDLQQAHVHLKEVDELKSAFISVITHEMRTPLANIAFSLQILEMYGLTQMLPEQREQMDQLKKDINQARKMVDNLVTFAQLLNKQVVLRLEEFDFGELIQETLIPLKEQAKDKNVGLHVDVIGKLSPTCGDRRLLSEAVFHLVQNAVKFTKSGGNIWVSCWDTSQTVCFDVKDTGIGVSHDKLPTLWTSFTQQADSLRRGVEGLGLGLAMVKYIVAAHDGEVWAESKENEGSIFGFKIPFYPTPVELEKNK